MSFARTLNPQLDRRVGAGTMKDALSRITASVSPMIPQVILQEGVVGVTTGKMELAVREMVFSVFVKRIEDQVINLSTFRSGLFGAESEFRLVLMRGNSWLKYEAVLHWLSLVSIPFTKIAEVNEIMRAKEIQIPPSVIVPVQPLRGGMYLAMAGISDSGDTSLTVEQHMNDLATARILYIVDPRNV